VAVVNMRRIHKGSVGANANTDRSAPFYVHAKEDGGGADQALQLTLDPALAVSLGNPETLTVTIVTP
jgi:hypothetical protein